MQIILENNIKKLVPTEKQYLLAKEDLEKPEEEKYYFEFAYLPPTATIAECEEKYVEAEPKEIQE